MENQKKEIGIKILKARLKKGYTYYKVAKDTGVSTAQIMSVENSTNNYTFESLLILCKYLELNIEINEI